MRWEETVVFLSTEAVRLAEQGYADEIFGLLTELDEAEDLGRGVIHGIGCRAAGRALAALIAG